MVVHCACRSRATGSAALDMAYVAQGRMDAYAALTIFCWDITAGVVLVRESGGVVFDTTG